MAMWSDMDKVLVTLCGMPPQQYTYDQLLEMAVRRIGELEQKLKVAEGLLAHIQKARQL